MNKIKKRKIYKNIYELEINFDRKDKSKNVKENYIFNGRSVTAICFNRKIKVFYLIRQFRPNYFFNNIKRYPLEIVAGGIKKKRGPVGKQFLREIHEETGCSSFIGQKDRLTYNCTGLPRRDY